MTAGLANDVLRALDIELFVYATVADVDPLVEAPAELAELLLSRRA